jgi:hypothetical protein
VECLAKRCLRVDPIGPQLVDHSTKVNAEVLDTVSRRNTEVCCYPDKEGMQDEPLWPKDHQLSELKARERAKLDCLLERRGHMFFTQDGREAEKLSGNIRLQARIPRAQGRSRHESIWSRPADRKSW